MGRPRDKWRVMVLEIATGRGFEAAPGDGDQGVPTWVDDYHLIFGDWPTGNPQQIMRLHVLDLRERKTSLLAGSEKLWTARCSPDGRLLAALSQDSKTLFISEYGSPDWRQVLSGNSLDDLAWAADAKSLFLMRDRELVRVGASASHFEKIATLRDFSFAREQWFGLAPDGTPLALRAARGQEIYSIQWRP